MRNEIEIYGTEDKMTVTRLTGGYEHYLFARNSTLRAAGENLQRTDVVLTAVDNPHEKYPPVITVQAESRPCEWVIARGSLTCNHPGYGQSEPHMCMYDALRFIADHIDEVE